jgi:hypothetical protein
MKRIDFFKTFKECPLKSKALVKMGRSGILVCENFIKENDDLDFHSFAYKCNRMFLDKPKPKHFVIIIDILVAANFHFYHQDGAQ